MRFIDLIGLIVENLSRRKGRVLLTAIGVVIGTSSVVILVSLGFGLQKSATSSLYGISDLKRIDVNPNYQAMEAMAMPMGGGGGGGSGKPGQMVTPVPITDQVVEDIKALPGVTEVITRDWLHSSAIMNSGKLESWIGINAMGVDDLSVLDFKMLTGTTVLERGTMIIGEELTKQFYDPRWRPGQPTPEPPQLQDQQIKMTIMRYTSEGMEVRRSYQIRVAGVIATCRCEADYSAYMRMEDVVSYNEWVDGRRINRRKDGYQNVTVKVADVDQVLDITDQINAMGFMATAQQQYVQGINSFFVILQVVFGGVGAVALLVAAIGIANTMTMAILERTREIGLMKAVGATNNNVLTVFLGEAAGIGFLGGLGGVLLGWGGGKALNIVTTSFFASSLSQQSYGGMPNMSVVTPLWLPLFSLGFATLVGILSGLYPALRAATLVPVTALKYE